MIRYLGEKVQIRVPLDQDDVLYVFSPEGKKLFDPPFLEEGNTLAEKSGAIGKLRKANTASAKRYNAGKKELDKRKFQTVSEAWAREHPDMIPQAAPVLQAVNGEPLPADEPPKPAKSALIICLAVSSPC
jgi:hypothetical protein